MNGVNGMKPKLLLNAGTCFSATSPLLMTLGVDQRYCHTGHTKEHNYLRHLEMGAKTALKPAPEEPLVAYRTSPILTQKWELPIIKPDHKVQNTKFKHRHPDLTKECKWMKDTWKLEEKRYFFDSPEVSLEKYIWYYNKIWDNVKSDYQSVADFSNENAVLSEKFMQEIKPILLEHFDIKVTMIFRDPIRRLWSTANRVCHKDLSQLVPYYKMCVSGQMEPNAYYHDIYKRHANVWGEENVHMIVMEEFSAGMVSKLERFIDFKLPIIHENVYYPEMGTNPPHYMYLSDQYTSDFLDLDKDTWTYARNHMNHIYESFEETFGYIPTKWRVWHQTGS